MGNMKHTIAISKKNEFLSVIAFCFLLCWAASLPKTAALLPRMTISSVRLLNGFIFTFSTVLGVIVGQLCSKNALRLKHLMLLSVFLCLGGTVLIYSLPLDTHFILTLITFIFFGLSFAFVLQFVLGRFSHTTRIWAVGAIVFTRIFLLLFSNITLPRLDSISPFTISIICIAIVIISTLSIDRSSAQAISNVSKTRSAKRTTYSFIFLMIYFIILSLSKGILLQRLTHYANYNPVYFSTGMISSYAIALFFIAKLSKRAHLNNIVYVANSIMIIAVILNISSKNPSWMVLIIYSILYFSFSINEIFCFDTLFEFESLLGNGPLIFCIAFASGSLSLLGGIIIFEYNYKAHVFSSEYLIVVLFALLTLVFPSFLIELSKISSSSVFRLSSIQYDQGESQTSAAETTTQTQGLADNEDAMRNIAEIKSLSVREKEVLELLFKGLPGKLICAKLFVSDNTLKSHIKSIYSKLGVHNRSELFLLLKKDSKQSK